ncbi:acyl-CoA-binding protein [Streptomyces sp. TP-A0356]|uniref:acyl-CoA-binding domain-containing protein n=1 Tax=Streptomyces sp. TP-A0356 TaxID=1359208 RepID=UPI00099EE3B7|nr:acyl-CoA-binding protein [Streptomyces sp. TP-A0356]
MPPAVVVDRADRWEHPPPEQPPGKNRNVGRTGQRRVRTAGRRRETASKPDNDILPKFYTYFKQAIVGDNDTAAPGMFDLTGKAKWNAWKELGGMSQNDATLKYIETARATIAKHG